jgi:hypothetical protein
MTEYTKELMKEYKKTLEELKEKSEKFQFHMLNEVGRNLGADRIILNRVDDILESTKRQINNIESTYSI